MKAYSPILPMPVHGPSAERTSGAAPTADTTRRGDFVFAVLYVVGTLGAFTAISQLLNVGGLAPVLFLPLYGWLVCLLVLQASRGRIVPASELVWTFLIVLGLSLAAVSSYKPFASLMNVALLFFDFLFALWLAHHVRGIGLAKVIVWSCALLYLLAVPVGAVSPDLLIYHDPLQRANVLGFFNVKGLFVHKIHAGIYSGIAALYALTLWRAERRKLYLWMTLMFVGGFLASGSSLALVSFVSAGAMAWAVLWLWRRLGWPVVVYGLMWVAFAGLAVLALDLYPMLMEALGRDPNLTGRLPIWLYAISSFVEHPLLGQGYGVFFELDANSPAQGLWRTMRWYAAPSFHSGYLQILAEAGIVGGGLFFVVLGKSIKRCFESGQFLSLWVVLILTFANLGAALFVTHRSLLFILMICFAFQPAAQPQRARSSPGLPRRSGGVPPAVRLG